MRLKEEDVYLMLVAILATITILLAVNLVIQDNSKAGVDNRHEVIEQFEMQCEYDMPTYEI